MIDAVAAAALGILGARRAVRRTGRSADARTAAGPARAWTAAGTAGAPGAGGGIARSVGDAAVGHVAPIDRRTAVAPGARGHRRTAVACRTARASRRLAAVARLSTRRLAAESRGATERAAGRAPRGAQLAAQVAAAGDTRRRHHQAAGRHDRQGNARRIGHCRKERRGGSVEHARRIARADVARSARPSPMSNTPPPRLAGDDDPAHDSGGGLRMPRHPSGESAPDLRVDPTSSSGEDLPRAQLGHRRTGQPALQEFTVPAE